jgi:hypothetical protein
MTTTQLLKATGIQKNISDIKKEISALKAETIYPINLTQSVPVQDIPNVNISVKADEHIEYRKSLRVVLEATKQTILSIYERELQRLEKEFENI